MFIVSFLQDPDIIGIHYHIKEQLIKLYKCIQAFFHFIMLYQGNQKYGKILRKGYVDMVPKNCFVDGDELLWFDQEWTLDYIPVKFVLYRAIF